LQQVFLNLFLNARDAMPLGGELKIKTFQKNGELSVEITDNGAGIDEKNLKKIFDPFFTTKPTGKGTGLGLAVCYGIVTGHGGRIEVESNEIEGTTFKVFLPIQRTAD
jgi:two-component system, NtrC family, sensor kinase